jgi:septum formation protein
LNLLTNLLKNYQIILASQSPRRINLLKSLGLDFEIIPANIDEHLLKETKPSMYCKKLALSKAQFVSKIIDTKIINIKPNNLIAENILIDKKKLIIAADTIVVLDGEIINKPTDKIDAFNILRRLSGNNHFVYTGVTVLNSANSKAITDYSRTTVYFRKLSDTEILDYIDTGSPMDKAGGYGIQDDYGALFVKRIEGCYNNVIGLPLELLFKMLIKAIE